MDLGAPVAGETYSRARSPEPAPPSATSDWCKNHISALGCLVNAHRGATKANAVRGLEELGLARLPRALDIHMVIEPFLRHFSLCILLNQNHADIRIQKRTFFGRKSTK